MHLALKATLFQRKGVVVFLIFLLHLTICGYLNFNHAMWRDELQLWLVASESDSFSALIANKEYEVRPYIWFLICWVLSRFTKNPEILKVFNFGVSIALASLLLYGFRKNMGLRIGFLFGFLTLFGYSAISQEYLLGTLIFLFSVFLLQKGSKTIFVFITAGVLANINLMFAITSIGIAGVPTIALLTHGNARDTRKRTTLGIAIYSGLFLFSVASMWPPKDFSFRSTSLSLDTLAVKRMFAALSDALFPFIARNSMTGIFGTVFVYSLSALSLLAVLALISSAFKKSIALGVSSAAAMSLLIIWTGIGYAAYWWHFGILFVAYFGFSLASLPNWESALKVQKVTYLLTCLILVSQSVALFSGPNLGIFPSDKYSMARDTSVYIRELCQSECTILTDNEVTGTSISAYLDGRDIFRANRGNFGSFAVWDPAIGIEVTWDDLLRYSTQFSNPVFVTSVLKDPPKGITVLAEFYGAVWSDEDFMVSRPTTKD